MKVYLDNAATTPLDERVRETMLPHLLEDFGNPSSIHAHGRKARSAVEKARKKVAELLNTSPSEIFFTSGGTEADNFALMSSVDTYQIKHAISTGLEHHAVLHTLQYLEKLGKIRLSLVQTDEKGNLDFSHLEELLSNNTNSLVSLMHANNEIGNIYDLERIGSLCQEHQAIFHSDAVQTVGHYVHNLQKLSVDYLAGAAHKFHGPKGIGFLYINADKPLKPLLHGGSQERNMRGGTENVYGIVGLAKALEVAYAEMQQNQDQVRNLKKHMMDALSQKMEGIQFNGESGDLEKSTRKVLNVQFPAYVDSEMLLFNLDIQGVAASGGSACSSGSDVGSHVLQALNVPDDRANVRFSFSKYNTLEEIDFVVEKVVEISKEAVSLS